uniref:Major capsid protein L1 n=1 Tax=Human papillomavirus TaxID=10566 RepID=A0A3R5W7A6_9PAPI|nr:MAG: L1 protein [Human papillomavirus]
MSALWLPTSGPLYLPPPKPVARVLRTDEYVAGTDVYFHASSDRLLIVGNPYFDVKENPNQPITVPKVSANQYRVFKCELPDPNKFALIDKKLYNPERQRLVWRLVGIEIKRGGPLGIGTTGHPYFNKTIDTENPSVYPVPNGNDQRMNVSIDPKQTQLFIIGCAPATGEYWDTAKPCKNPQKGDCPPIELVNNIIQDGDMGDIGFGAANFKNLQQDKAGVPLDIVNTFSIWPDFIKMTNEIYGDSIFFWAKREQMFSRHLWARAGTIGDAIPDENSDYFLHPSNNEGPQKDIASFTYFCSPSGSLASSDNQLFNKPYWLRRAQGNNNGICWGNNLFVTVFDNTRGTNFTLSVYKEDGTLNNDYQYKAGDFKQYSRHVEEYEIELIFQLCTVTLDPDVLAHIHVMNPRVLEEWQLGFVPPIPQGIEDAYRYLKSAATKCPPEQPTDDIQDPYADLNFWKVDLKEKFSSDLSQHTLGRKFLYQVGLLNGKKRMHSDYTVNTRRTVKRKRTK